VHGSELEPLNGQEFVLLDVVQAAVGPTQPPATRAKVESAYVFVAKGLVSKGQGQLHLLLTFAGRGLPPLLIFADI
jgi:hypothetical protein